MKIPLITSLQVLTSEWFSERIPDRRGLLRELRLGQRAQSKAQPHRDSLRGPVVVCIPDHHWDFDRYFRRLGLIKFSSATFQRLLQAGSDSEIAKAGMEAGSDTPRSIILA
jgi:hypothetical protein